MRSPAFFVLRAVVAVTFVVDPSRGFRLDIIHTNDMHSHFQEISRSTGTCVQKPCYGGFSRVATMARKLKSEHPNSLFLNAGDNFQGTDFFAVFKEDIVAQLVDTLGIDAMSLGNHEFDLAIKRLVHYLQIVKTPTVTANLDTSLEPQLRNNTNLSDWKMFTIDGVKIAVIGYVTTETPIVSNTGKVKFLDEITVLEKLSREVREQGAQVVIALGHSGYQKDQEIAQKVKDIDAVVGGHTHTFLYTGEPPDATDKPAGPYPTLVKQESGKVVPVVQAYQYTKYLGHLILEFDSEMKLTNMSGAPILLDSSVEQDPTIQRIVDDYDQQLENKMSEVVGTTLVDLDGVCRSSECNLGNLITDAMVDYAARFCPKKEHQWTEAPIAIWNGGSIRSSIVLSEAKGNISSRALIGVMPFENQVVLMTMKADVLLAALEKSVEKLTAEQGVGGFLQVSGLRLKYDMTRPAGSRLVDVTLRCGKCDIPKYEPLHMDETLNVIMNKFMAGGGDGYDMFQTSAVVNRTYSKFDLEILQDYIARYSPMYPALENRVIVDYKTSPQPLPEPSGVRGPAASAAVMNHVPSVVALLLVSTVSVIKYVWL